MKILRQQGTRYGWREVAIFPEDFFDDVGVPVGPRYLHLYQGRRVFAVIGTPGLVLMSSVNGKLKPHEGGEPRILMRSDGRAEIEALAPPTTLIFGSDAPASSGVGHANNRLLVSKFVKTNDGAVTTGKVELSGQDGWYLARVRLVALTDNAGAPDSVLWYSPEITPADDSTEQTFTLPSDVSGTDAAGTYWLGIAVYELPGQTRGASLTGVNSALVNGFNVATPPDSAGAVDTLYEDYGFRVWCEYSE